MTVSGVAVNNVLPGRIGDLLRARWLGLAARMSAGRAFGTVVLDRACDLVVLVALLVIGIAAVATSEWLVRLAAGGVLVVAAFGAVLLFARAYIGKRERGRHSAGWYGGSCATPSRFSPSRSVGGARSSGWDSASARGGHGQSQLN